MVDIGTGDGLFVYQGAQANPKKFFIGIDPNPRPLEKVSEKIHRKPAKGGLSNVLFIQCEYGPKDECEIHGCERVTNESTK